MREALARADRDYLLTGGSSRRGRLVAAGKSLPADLHADDVWPVGGDDTSCLGGIRSEHQARARPYGETLAA